MPRSVALAAAVDDARNALTRRITDANGGQAGAVAAALVTGKRGLINAETNEVLRAAGIYHVVSISGLHMVLAAGVVFWLVRALLALIPGLALVWPIKKIAAGFAMVGVTAYCVFSGWDIAAERSLIMTLVMLGAILVDRPALSMRNLALAALIALAREPDGILGPSFQMSFGAVAGLIACAGALNRWMPPREGAGLLARTWRFLAVAVLGTLATTLIAQIATASFATYHFQTVQPFGIVGNALTLPLVSLAVMPAAVLGILAYPFALDQPVWWAMGLAVRGMLTISGWISGFGHATLVVPAYGSTALCLLALALLLLTLPVSSLRWIGLAPAALGVVLATMPPRYDVYIDREGGGAAFRDGDGRLSILGSPPAFVLEQWLKADGDSRKVAAVAASPRSRCDTVGCVVELGPGRIVALVKDKRAFAEDCERASVIIARRDAPKDCRAGFVIDRAYLALRGATAIRFGPEGPQVTSAHQPHSRPPWRRAVAVVTPSPFASEGIRTECETHRSRGRRRRSVIRNAAGRASVTTDQADEPPLDLNTIRSQNPRLVGGVCRLQSDGGTAATQALQCGLFIVDEGNDDVACIRSVLLLDHDKITVEDTRFDHRIATDLQRVMFAAGQEVRVIASRNDSDSVWRRSACRPRSVP